MEPKILVCRCKFDTYDSYHTLLYKADERCNFLFIDDKKYDCILITEHLRIHKYSWVLEHFWTEKRLPLENINEFI